jgi:hypothetical protein
MRKFEEEMVNKITSKLIKKLKYDRIKKVNYIEIFTNNNWLTIDTDSKNLNTPFLQMIIGQWKEQTKKEVLSLEDRDFIERIRYNISVHFYNQLSNLLQKRMELEFEAKYLGGLLFEIHWKEQRYEVKLAKFKEKIWVPENLPLNKIFLEDIKINLCENEMNFSLQTLLLTKITFLYLSKIYKQTSEYKLKNMYK